MRVTLAGVTLIATGRFALGVYGGEASEAVIGWLGPFTDRPGATPLFSTVPAQK